MKRIILPLSLLVCNAHLNAVKPTTGCGETDQQQETRSWLSPRTVAIGAAALGTAIYLQKNGLPDWAKQFMPNNDIKLDLNFMYGVTTASRQFVVSEYINKHGFGKRPWNGVWNVLQGKQNPTHLTLLVVRDGAFAPFCVQARPGNPPASGPLPFSHTAQCGEDHLNGSCHVLWNQDINRAQTPHTVNVSGINIPGMKDVRVVLNTLTDVSIRASRGEPAAAARQ